MALGTGWHNVELCGTVGTDTTWNLYRDGTQIVTNWVANTGTTPVGRIQIGDTAAKTFTVNFDHVVLDTAPGDDVTGDTTAPSVPGRPAGNSPSAGSIQISWAASTDPAPASLPITYRIYRDGGATSVGSTTTTSFTDTGLVAGSSHTYTVDAIDAANNASAKSQASLSITVTAAVRHDAPRASRAGPRHQPDSAGSIQITWTASTDPRRVAPDHVPRLSRRRRDLGRVDHHDVVHRHGPGRRLEPHLHRRGGGRGEQRQRQEPGLAVDHGDHRRRRRPAGARAHQARTDVPRTNIPRITTGEITDLEYIGNRVFVAGTFTSIRNNTATNTTSYNQPYLASFNIDTGLVDTDFRPTFGGGGVTEVEASPDGTKLFVVGTFNTVNGVTKRKVASLNPTTGAP